MCSLSACILPSKSRGMCNMHYLRWWKTGDPLSVQTRCGLGTTREIRFWSKVLLTANSDKCWVWTGTVNANGYGTTRYENRPWLTHRLAWSLSHNAEPSLNILHSCHNRPCCNPQHLREGTQKENMQDAIERGTFFYIHGKARRLVDATT